jgi:hypothetical protein
MKIQCPICPVIKKNVIAYFTDIKFITTREFVTKAYNKHLFWSLILTVPSIIVLILFFDLDDVGVPFQLFVGGFGAYFVNGVREWVRSKLYGIEWDQVDIHMGSYGGILGALLATLIF